MLTLIPLLCYPHAALNIDRWYVVGGTMCVGVGRAVITAVCTPERTCRALQKLVLFSLKFFQRSNAEALQRGCTLISPFSHLSLTPCISPNPHLNIRPSLTHALAYFPSTLLHPVVFPSLHIPHHPTVLPYPPPNSPYYPFPTTYLLPYPIPPNLLPYPIPPNLLPYPIPPNLLPYPIPPNLLPYTSFPTLSHPTFFPTPPSYPTPPNLLPYTSFLPYPTQPSPHHPSQPFSPHLTKPYYPPLPHPTPEITHESGRPALLLQLHRQFGLSDLWSGYRVLSLACLEPVIMGLTIGSK
ncbi:hypothetical protein Pcinc_031560 [Petrolisthes cinctipes]|uniref:Uncharacterized protein n=1 Tax=Petrolisthes cinctipes TaxID=88211 RepID=A0AAE1EVX2_PETCI|nr:hypothetical protein Pcinc_031560 [Petrolisthes cinctipes]